MYFSLFKPQNWWKRSVEARRRNCAVLPLFYVFHGKADALALFIDLQHPDLYHIADRDDLGRMPDKFAADLRNMHQTVLMHANVYKDAEVNDVAHRAAQLHAGLQILQLQNVGPENRRGQLVARVASGLDQLLDNVEHCRNAAPAASACRRPRA